MIKSTYMYIILIYLLSFSHVSHIYLLKETESVFISTNFCISVHTYICTSTQLIMCFLPDVFVVGVGTGLINTMLDYIHSTVLNILVTLSLTLFVRMSRGSLSTKLPTRLC